MRNFRLSVVGSLVALAILVAPAAIGANSGEGRVLTARADLGRAILANVNAVRAQHGLGSLRASSALARAASRHSTNMARQGFFAHESADGSPFWKRVQRFYGSSGYHSWQVGENLLWSSPDVTAEKAVQMWLSSPRHRKILLTRSWADVGLSAVHATSADGTFEGREVTIVTADFGVRVK